MPTSTCSHSATCWQHEITRFRLWFLCHVTKTSGSENFTHSRVFRASIKAGHDRKVAQGTGKLPEPLGHMKVKRNNQVLRDVCLWGGGSIKCQNQSRAALGTGDVKLTRGPIWCLVLVGRLYVRRVHRVRCTGSLDQYGKTPHYVHNNCFKPRDCVVFMLWWSLTGPPINTYRPIC